MRQMMSKTVIFVCILFHMLLSFKQHYLLPVLTIGGFVRNRAKESITHDGGQ